jgi:hypothetical protein
MELTTDTMNQIELTKTVREIHTALTKKFPSDGETFDAWYTNRGDFWKTMDQLSRLTAQKLREIYGIKWNKTVSEPIFSALEAKGTAPKEWEDGPDGSLAALAIIISAWVAHQAAEKSRNNPNDAARRFFDGLLKPLVIAAMDEGTRMADNP